MKRIDKLVLGSLLGPFILASFISLLVFDLQFLWKYVDDLVGKGLSMGVITKLIFYFSANMVILALPLGILLGTLMTFGNMGERLELTAMKSAGVPLVRFMRSAVMLTFVVAVGVFLFSNYVLPKANLKFLGTLASIYEKKPTINIKAGTFYKEIDGYSILIGSKGEEGRYIYNVVIYDHTDVKGNGNLLLAKSGEMYLTEDERYLVLELNKGHQYQEMAHKLPHDVANEHVHTQFENYKKVFDLASFAYKQTDEELFKNNYSALGLKDLVNARDSVANALLEKDFPYIQSIQSNLFILRDTGLLKDVSVVGPPMEAKRFIENIPKELRSRITQRSVNRANNMARHSKSLIEPRKGMIDRINRYEIEIWRKYTMAFTCLVFLLIGAPLGAIIRRGGFGFPILVSVLFFVFFWVLMITFEKLAKQMIIPAWFGMWAPNLLILPLGIFLTIKAMNDSALLNLEAYREKFDKLLRKIGFTKT